LNNYECNSTQIEEIEPTTFTEANKDHKWRIAMDEELEALETNKTWTLVPKDTTMNVVGSKWVFEIKRKSDGMIERYKVRSVAKGFNQEEGVDYNSTYSPVIRMNTVRTIISIAVTNGWQLRQLDIKNAFLNGYLNETVYMKQPTGYQDKEYPNHVCLLHKALYGLKQAPRAWYSSLQNFLTDKEFTSSKTDSSLFVKIKE